MTVRQFQFCCVCGLVDVLVLSLGVCHAQTLVVTRNEVVPFTKEEVAKFVQAHNEVRKAVGSPPVEWSENLAQFASEWLVSQKEKVQRLAEEGQFPNPGHRDTGQKYGENLALWGGTPGAVSSAPEKAVADWLKEKPGFDKLNQIKPYVVGDEQGQVDENNNPIIVGHYTQLVWKTTKRIGAARQIIEISDDKGRPVKKYVVVLSNYDPPGNVLGRKPY